MKKTLLILFFICTHIMTYGQTDAGLKTLKAAEAGDAEAQFDMYMYYEGGYYGFPEDESKAFYWLKKSAENGYAKAQLSLGVTFFNGKLGQVENRAEGFKWVKKSAENGDAGGQYVLAIYYKHGVEGVTPKNENEFLKWCMKSANGGDEDAMEELGDYYRDKKDNQEAIYWYKKAMDAHYKEEGSEDTYVAEKLRKLGVHYHPRDKSSSTTSSTATASTSSSTSSTSNSKSSSSDKKLLYKGTYTINEQGYYVQGGTYTQSGRYDYTVEIEIYEDYLWVEGVAPGIGRFDYVRTTSSGMKVYEGMKILSSLYYYIVNPTTYDMTFYCDTFNSYTGSTDTFSYAMTKGKTSFNKHYNNSNNNSYNYSSNNSSYNSSQYSSSPKQETTTRHKCHYCNGTGEIIQHEQTSTFGLNGPRVYCNICNKSFNYGTVHAHHKCNYCNGTGYRD